MPYQVSHVIYTLLHFGDEIYHVLFLGCSFDILPSSVRPKFVHKKARTIIFKVLS